MSDSEEEFNSDVDFAPSRPGPAAKSKAKDAVKRKRIQDSSSDEDDSDDSSDSSDDSSDDDDDDSSDDSSDSSDSDDDDVKKKQSSAKSAEGKSTTIFLFLYYQFNPSNIILNPQSHILFIPISSRP